MQLTFVKSLFSEIDHEAARQAASALAPEDVEAEPAGTEATGTTEPTPVETIPEVRPIRNLVSRYVFIGNFFSKLFPELSLSCFSSSRRQHFNFFGLT